MVTHGLPAPPNKRSVIMPNASGVVMLRMGAGKQ